MSRQNFEYLYQIKYSIDKIIEYTSNISYQDFENEKIIQDSVIRRFDVIIYACQKLSNEIKDRIDFIPWDRIINIKSKLVDDEYEVNTSKVWEIVKEDLPILKDDINKVIEQINK